MTAIRLLIIDDDEAVGSTIAAIARTAGADALVTQHAQQFFDRLADFAPTHLAIDLMMPDMDGVQVISRLAELGCRASIIITSGLQGRILDAAARSAEEHGLVISGILKKPFTAQSLRDLLQAESLPEHLPTKLVARESAAQEGLDLDRLRAGLAAGEVFPVFQPKICCISGELRAFEVLARWRHPELGLQFPDNFIPLAERGGLMEILTESMSRQSLQWLAESDPGRHIGLAINVSASSISRESEAGTWFGDVLTELCREYAIEPRQITLEVTESEAMQAGTRTLDRLTRMRMAGFSLSIDDFGTGHSTMSQLVRLPYSELKIDRSFVMTSDRSEESRKVVRSVIELAHSLEMQCTAEGVETESALALLCELGCDLAQGYHIARPMLADAARGWLHAHAETRAKATP